MLKIGNLKDISLTIFSTIENGSGKSTLDESELGIEFVPLHDLIRVVEDIPLITHMAYCSDRCVLLSDDKIIKEGGPWEITKFFRKECKVCPSKKYSLRQGYR